MKYRFATGALALALWVTTCVSNASTIFLLTDGKTTLFCSNEDSTNTHSRIWFNPSKGRYGCVYVGFEGGQAESGMNSAGLAFDWAPGVSERWAPRQDARKLKGNPLQRMLEQCATVEEAIAFLQKHRIAAFANARVLVADPSGTSAIIGPRDGRLEVIKAKASGVLGHHSERVRDLLNEDASPTLNNAATILEASQQQGKIATRYSTVFDLETGRITVHQFSRKLAPVVLDLQAELKKGAYYYNLPTLEQELSSGGKRLTSAMKRS